MKKLLLIICLFVNLICFPQANLVKDINLGNNSSSPKAKIAFNNEVYFSANDGINGTELWKTDGTESGTVLVKDINEGIDSGISFFKPFATNNYLYFFATEDNKQFLWKTDGTEIGTEKVKEFSSVGSMYDEVNGKIIFSAENSLWASDGTENGTIKIATYSVFGEDRFVKNGNEIYFSAESSSSIGKEIYKTDGTVTGTVLVKDIRSGSSDSFPNQFVSLNNLVYFSANNGTNGTELWKTDGTEAGTTMVQDINAGSGNSFSYNSVLETFNNELFFLYNNGLWKSDGTANGATEVKSNLGIIKTLFILNDKILVIAYNSTTKKQVIWVSDGTEVGTTNFETDYTEFSHNSEYDVVGNSIFFQGNRADTGYELWKTDGTETGTYLVKDIHPSFDDNNIESIVNLNGKAIFTASDGNWLGKELWISDGTENGTTLLKDINKEGNRSSNPQNHFQFGNKILFTSDNGVNGIEPWIIDNGNVNLLKDINPGALYSNPANFIEFNGIVYFAATSKEKGKELWKTDGTEAGTVLVIDINKDESNGLGSSPIVALNNKLYFFADDGTTGMELWESDGTSVGTKIVKDIDVNNTSSYFNPSELVVMNNELFFAADDGTNGSELWKSDGTNSGTQLVKEINTNGSSNIRYLNVHPYLNKLYFSAYDGSGTNLWESDGTSNTFKQQIKNPSQFQLSGTRDIGDRNGSNIIYNTELFFSGESTSNFNKKGTELWVVTYSGSIQLAYDINPSTSSSYPSYLTDVNGKLYFVANDGSNGSELWKANGIGSAEMIKNIESGNNNSNIVSIGNIGDTVIFGAGNNSQNRELWKSDGTEEGTILLQDLNPSTAQYGNGSNPSNFFSYNDTLYFSANNGSVGNELFMLQESALSVVKENIKTSAKFQSYPNPTSNNLYIKVDNQQIKEVKIYNLMGKEVFKASAKENINISQLSSGMYIIQVKTSSNTFTKKIIKQ